jgi:hypothetical protein
MTGRDLTHNGVQESAGSCLLGAVRGSLSKQNHGGAAAELGAVRAARGSGDGGEELRLWFPGWQGAPTTSSVVGVSEGRGRTGDGQQ